MKPLDLKVFERHPSADAYRVGGFYSPYCLVATEKRFTDAELAAEYLFVVHGDNTVLEWHQWEGEYRSPQSIAEQVYRFATLPHLDGAS